MKLKAPHAALALGLMLGGLGALFADAPRKAVGHTQIAVVVSGAGTVKPSFSGRELKVGSWIHPKVKPARGYVWAGWVVTRPSGVVECYECDTFAVEPGLQLEARFVPNPFPAVQGSYRGAITATNGSLSPAGRFVLKLTEQGGLTGTLTCDGRDYPIGGKGYRQPVHPDGHVALSFHRGNPLDGNFRQVMTADLQFDVSHALPRVTGSLRDAREVKIDGQWTPLPCAWEAGLSGARVPD